jgi:hypothetical protein
VRQDPRVTLLERTNLRYLQPEVLYIGDRLLLRPGNGVRVGVAGCFGNRLVDMAGSYGGEVRAIAKPGGHVPNLEALRLRMYHPIGRHHATFSKTILSL